MAVKRVVGLGFYPVDVAGCITFLGCLNVSVCMCMCLCVWRHFLTSLLSICSNFLHYISRRYVTETVWNWWCWIHWLSVTCSVLKGPLNSQPTIRCILSFDSHVCVKCFSTYDTIWPLLKVLLSHRPSPLCVYDVFPGRPSFCCRCLPARFHSTCLTFTSCGVTWTTCFRSRLTCQSLADQFCE